MAGGETLLEALDLSGKVVLGAGERRTSDSKALLWVR
jgi:hypothetical protein